MSSGGGSEGDGGGGDGGGGEGDGGNGDGGGEGQLPGPQLEPWPAEVKAEVPAHAQRMSRLLAADKGAPCRVGRRVYEAGCVVRAGRREGVGQRWRKRHARY